MYIYTYIHTYINTCIYVDTDKDKWNWIAGCGRGGRIPLRLTSFCLDSVDYPWSHSDLLDLTWAHLDSLDLAGTYSDSHDLTVLNYNHLITPRLTWSHCTHLISLLDSLEFTWPHVLFTGTHWISLGFTWSHLDSAGPAWYHLISLGLTCLV